MDPIKRNRFTLEEEPGEREYDFTGEGSAGPRIRSLEPEEGRPRGRLLSFLKNRRYLPIVIIASVALLAVLTILILTQFVYKKPESFRNRGDETLFSGNEKKELPLDASENLRIKRGKESYFKGYFNDALAEFTEVVESDAADTDKAIALTYMGIIQDDRGDYNKAIEYYGRALRYNKSNPLIYRNLALAYRHKKDYEKADQFIGKALDIDSKNINNQVLRGNILFEQGKYKEAVRQYEEALRTDPENASTLYNLAVTLLKTGDEVTAIEYLKKAGASDKMGEVAHLSYSKLGVLFTQTRDYDLAEKYLKMAGSINPRDPVDRYNLGVVYLKQNKAERALEEFRKAEELGKGDAAVLESLGEAYFSMKDYDRSVDTYNRLLETNRRNTRVLSRIAEIYYEKGDLENAYEFYRKITTLEPASENARVAYLNMGNILDDAQRYDEAIASYEKALAISPKDDAALYNLGIAYRNAGKPEMALRTWKSAAELNPDNPKPLMAIADYYYERNMYDAAMDEYQRILRRWPNIQDGHFNLGTIYYKKNQMDYAAEEYKRVIEINDRNDLARKAYVNLGILTSKTAKDEDGMNAGANYIQKALLLKPGDAESLYSLGLLYFKKEMPDKAIDTFYQAIKATSDSKIIAECYNNIGKSYYKKGQHKKALQAFSRGVDEDPTNEEIRMNRKVAMQAYEEQMAR